METWDWLPRVLLRSHKFLLVETRKSWMTPWKWFLEYCGLNSIHLSWWEVLITPNVLEIKSYTCSATDVFLALLHIWGFGAFCTTSKQWDVGSAERAWANVKRIKERKRLMWVEPTRRKEHYILLLQNKEKQIQKVLGQNNSSFCDFFDEKDINYPLLK